MRKRFRNEEGKENLGFRAPDPAKIPTIDEFKAADDFVSKKSGPAGDETFFEPEKSLGPGPNPSRERRADAKADVIAFFREQEDEPRKEAFQERLRQRQSRRREGNPSFVKNGFGVNFANVERSQRRAEKTSLTDNRDLRQDRRLQADEVVTSYEDYKGRRDQVDLAGYDTKNADRLGRPLVNRKEGKEFLEDNPSTKQEIFDNTRLGQDDVDNLINRGDFFPDNDGRFRLL